ncbi:AraC family transcriptional regulator [Aliirhizobium terrae]|uniref:helix-turn-helix domain-containing protein n=1 Tax=Terrirhizobium terrae TaxID=2926709 RepID=UPI002575B416|nr:AraC family transcriptional regulator [Rhizobium sp. CC-CFT758]WJH40513.1 AraC family transcriptional regulator [Rhizobium sp. CC-CFT758]
MYLLSSPEGLRRHINGTLLTRNAASAWGSISVQILSHEASESSLLVPAVAEPLLVWIVSGAVHIEEREFGGDWIASDVSAGSFYLTHSPTPYEMRWQTVSGEPFVVMHLYLGLGIYQRAVAEVWGRQAEGEYHLRDVSGVRDETISRLMEMIRTEVAGSAYKSEMYLDGLAQSLAIHIVRHYGDIEQSLALRRGALPAFKLQRVTQVMEAGLDKPFSLESLAGEAGLSPYHFSRMFKQSTGSSPSEYFIQMKIAKARRLLRETELNIVSIALDLGYASPSHFARVFKRQIGVTPREYRS